MLIGSQRARLRASVLIISGLYAGAAFAQATNPITEFIVPTGGSQPYQIVAGPDGAMWFTELSGNKIGRVTTAGIVSEFAVTTSGSQPKGIVSGPDGALWFTEQTAGKIGRVSVAGAVTEFTVPTASSQPAAIALGPDGAMWFVEQGASKIGRVATSGAILEYATPSANSGPQSIVAGPDGNLWFTEVNANKIGRITPAGSIVEFANPNSAARVNSISRGPDGRLYFTETQIDLFASLDTAGNFHDENLFPSLGGGAGFVGPGPDAALWLIEHNANKLARAGAGTGGTPVFTEYDIPTSAANVATLAAGPDGNLWFTEQGSGKIGRLTPRTSPTPLVAAVLPSSRSVEVGTTATAFATIVNGGAANLGNCTITPLTSVPAGFFFQTTDPASNLPTGTVNTPVSLNPGASQSFVFGFSTNAPFSPQNVVLAFKCGAVDPAVPVIGLNDLLLSASATPIPDIIALSATTSRNGLLSIGTLQGTGAFAVASVNIGASSPAITVTPVVAGGITLPLSLTICQTNPVTAACMAAPAASVTTPIDANATPTFSIFATASGTIANLPATNRIVVRFTDAGGIVRGSTSVAVQASTSVASSSP